MIVVSPRHPARPATFSVRRLRRTVTKKLILDRGFIDGRKISHCHQELGVQVLIPMKKKMDIWDDAWALGQTQPWLDVPVSASLPRPVPANRPPELQRRENKRQQTLAARKAQEPPPPLSQQWQRTQVCPIKGFTSWSETTVPMHVLLLRDSYADGRQESWGLMTTADFVDPFEPMRDYALRTSIEERHRLLKCFYDLSDFRSRSFNAIVAQVVFVLLSYTLRQWQLWKLRQVQIAGVTPKGIKKALSFHREYVVIYHQSAYTQMPLVVFARELLELESPAREKALHKLRQLEQSMLCPLENLRPP
jgi:IS4 transposase